MSGWITDMADAVDEYEAAQAPPQSKASMPAVYHEEVPTEPATSPRSQVTEVPVLPTYIEELRLPSREYGPHPEPGRFVTRWASRGGYTQEEWEAYFRKHRQAWSNHDMEKERQQAEAAEYEAHLRSIQEWEAKVKARELDNAALPCGPTPDGTSSMRALPDVHEALRQNDPKMTSYSQPVVKKAPPTLGRSRPSAFYSDAEPPRIGAQPVQPPPPAAPRPVDASSANLPLAATPMTPGHPPRPPREALPKYPSMETSSCASKQHRLHRASMFDARRSYTLLSLQIKSLWQHLQPLRCLRLADHVRRVLQPSSCLHLQKLSLCSQTCAHMTGDLA